MTVELEKVEALIRDYGNRFWAKGKCEEIILHVREGLNLSDVKKTEN